MRLEPPNATLRASIAKTDRNPVDVHIGNQVRLKRIAVGLSQAIWFITPFIGMVAVVLTVLAGVTP